MITKISSKDNKVYKSFTKLLKKKFREQTNSFLIEEINLVEEACLCGVEIKSLIVKKGCWDNLPSCVADNLDSLNCFELTEELYDNLNQAQTSRGIMAQVVNTPYSQEDLCKDGRSTNLVVLDRLQDPGNVGTIIRTADGAGIGGIVVIKGTCDIYSPKVLRSSVGSIFRVPIVYTDSAKEAIELIRSLNKRVVVSCFEGAVNYCEAPLSHDVALVIGNEGQGVSDTFLNNADIKVKIPMFGSLESLNASVAASLLMYETDRQIRYKSI